MTCRRITISWLCSVKRTLQPLVEEAKMNARVAVALVGLSLMNAPPANAEVQTYPAKAVRVIVPGPAGGGLDVIARYVVAQLTSAGRGQLYLENLPGAGGAVGARHAG